MAKFKYITGQKFGRWTAIKRATFEHPILWHCICECGAKSILNGCVLRGGRSKSCGCLSRKHGMYQSRTYRSWAMMLVRCFRKNHKDYATYGAVGITVCKKWKKFENFLADMGIRPEGKTLDRINNKKGYYADNCRWATPKEQALNRNDTIYLNLNGQKRSIEECSNLTGINRITLFQRVKRLGKNHPDLFGPVIGKKL